ncbi:MAG: hypothetical protein PVH21_07890 [Myxococcales bacterium]|jgi:hypothetical protein
MTGGVRVGVIVSLVVVFCSAAAPASAQRRGDGLYGRWDRAWTLELGAGGGATWLEHEPDPNVIGEARFLIADVAGIALAGRWGPHSGQHLFLGVDLRPLFPALFFLYKQTWNEFTDLVLQSVFFEIGPAFLLDGEQSTGLGVGFGLSLPLYRPLTTVEGLWLRIASRYVNADPSHRNTEPTSVRTQWTLYATFVVRLGFKSNLSKWEPPRYRAR